MGCKMDDGLEDFSVIIVHSSFRSPRIQTVRAKLMTVTEDRKFVCFEGHDHKIIALINIDHVISIMPGVIDGK